MMLGKGLVNRLAAFALGLLMAGAAPSAAAADGYGLWLGKAPGEAPGAAAVNPGPAVVDGPTSATVAVALAELQRGLAPGATAALDGTDGVVIVSDRAAGRWLALQRPLTDSPPGSYRIVAEPGGTRTLILGADDAGLLYGAFALLRHIGTGGDLANIDLTSRPAMPLRMLNHWDNPDGHVERGYAGRSIFDWWRLPERLDPRMIDYARANASLGINGVVVNNVNASPLFLTDRYLPKLARLAEAWRPYGIRLYVSARFSAPRDVGGLATADPLDPAVRAWWNAKADEIYAAIPDFGGFLVKASSEGQPGPGDYGRTHADGANMLAAALGDRGTVIWRAFVYSETDETDRVKQAYREFVPLDGKFADTVILQVKNGPLDFQPREPFHPLFGAMPNTRLMLEAQVTREYLGQASGVAYLAPMWEEVLGSDTGRGGTVADIIAPVGMAGVANTGSDRNWTGTIFDQANWYAFGRLAWDPSLPAERIAREWIAQTLGRDPRVADEAVPMMLGSWPAVVDYMAPLGLAHLMGTGHHYGPAPWVCDLARPEWNPCYYHRADREGIGFDRTASGSDALDQYAPAIANRWRDPATIDPDYLLWFHHLPWRYRLSGGETLWEALVSRYDRGVGRVDAMAARWNRLEGSIDPVTFELVSADLAIQSREARWWRDASLAYWQSLNGLALPASVAPPKESLERYRAMDFPEAPGR